MTHIRKELLEDDDGSFLKIYLKRAKVLFKKYKEINQSNFKKDFEKNISELYESNINQKLKKNLYHGVLEYERDVI